MPTHQSSSSKVAGYLRDHGPTILDTWKIRVKKEVPPAKYQTEPMLVDSLPIFLRALSRTLDPANPADDACANDVCRVHGEERADMPAYSIEGTLKEYSILRQVILELLEATFVLSRPDRDVVLTSIDEAMQLAGAAFMGKRTEAERGRAHVAEGRVKEMESESGHRERFVSTLSHDLRGPLGSVRMALELILNEIPETDSVTELASIMVRNLQQSESLISTLLDVNRLKSGGRLPLQIGVLDLKATIEQIAKDLAAVHGDRFVVSGDDVVIGSWSPNHVYRVVENMITNAVKYGAAKAPVAVVVRGDEATVSIAVHNSGNPIAAADQATLFDPYYRTSSARAGKAEGWGLGLALVKGVAEAHGGSVSVTSDAQQGTTFTVTLPRHAKAPHDEEG